MPPGLPRPMHPPHPIRQSTRDPIPREHQLLSLSQTDIHIVRNRRQRQRLRRLTNRTHQHPRRPASAPTGSLGIVGTAVRGLIIGGRAVVRGCATRAPAVYDASAAIVTGERTLG